MNGLPPLPSIRTLEASSFTPTPAFKWLCEDVVVVLGMTRLQALARARGARKRHMEMHKAAQHRHRVVSELLSSERSYVNSLSLCVDLYVVPLKDAAKANLVESAIVMRIFHGLDDVLAVNRLLLAQLEIYVEQAWFPNRCLGTFLERFTCSHGFMAAYGGFIEHYNESVRVLSEAKKESKFLRDFLAAQQADERSHHLPLEAILIMPVQRIPRYSLLVAELVKHTWSSHPDFAALSSALVKLNECNTTLNERKRGADLEHRVGQLREVMRQVGVDRFFPLSSEAFLLEGKFTDTHGQSIAVFLFEELLVFCIGDLDQNSFALADCRKLAQDFQVTSLATVNGFEQYFGLELGFPQQKERLRLLSLTEGTRDDWIEKLRLVKGSLGLRQSASVTQHHSVALVLGGAQKAGMANEAQFGWQEIYLHAMRPPRGSSRDVAQHLGPATSQSDPTLPLPERGQPRSRSRSPSLRERLGRTSMDRVTHQTDEVKQPSTSPLRRTEPNNAARGAVALDFHLSQVLEQMKKPHPLGVLVSDREWRLRTYRNVFVASEAVDWVVKHYMVSRAEGVHIMLQLQKEGHIHHVKNEHQFEDEFLFFVFTEFVAEAAISPGRQARSPSFLVQNIKAVFAGKSDGDRLGLKRDSGAEAGPSRSPRALRDSNLWAAKEAQAGHGDVDDDADDESDLTWRTRRGTSTKVMAQLKELDASIFEDDVADEEARAPQVPPQIIVQEASASIVHKIPHLDSLDNIVVSMAMNQLDAVAEADKGKVHEQLQGPAPEWSNTLAQEENAKLFGNTSSKPLGPAPEWSHTLEREEAAKLAANIATGGDAVGPSSEQRGGLSPRPRPFLGSHKGIKSEAEIPTVSSSTSSFLEMSIEQLIDRLRGLQVGETVLEQFRQQRIDGCAFCQLTAEILQHDFKMPLGDRLKIRKLLEEARASVWK